MRGTYKLRICMQIRDMQLFPALVANTNNQLALHKSSCTACDHLVVLWPICISGWVNSASTRFPPQAALHTPHRPPLPPPPEMSVLVVLDAKPQ